MRTHDRRRTHVVLLLFFAAQIPVALVLQFAAPRLFDMVWRAYLVFLSLYAIVSTHWTGVSAETPTKED